MQKNIFKRLLCGLVVIGLLIAGIPFTAIEASAAAPTSYTDIYLDQAKSVSVSTRVGEYFRFIPTYSATYKIYSYDKSGDPYVILLDSAGNQITYDDDSSPEGTNFQLTVNLAAGTTYYINACSYSDSVASYTFKIVDVSGCSHSYYEQSREFASCEDDGYITYFCSICGEEHIETLPATGHNFVGGTCTNCGQSIGGAVNIDAAGGTNYSLFNSGRTGDKSIYNTSANYDEESYNNGGYDLYADQGNLNEVIRLGLSFAVSIDINEQATLSINAYDVDEYDTYHGHAGDERDYIYLVNETTGTRTKLAGYLSGQNATWNNTSLTISPELLEVGNVYHFELDVDCTCGACGYWVVYVRTVNLTINGSTEPPIIPATGIENADLSASISASGEVTAYLEANAYAEEDYTLEYKAVCTSNGAQYGGSVTNVTIYTYTIPYTSIFNLEADALRGTYEITLFIKDAEGNVKATRTANASYGYSAVSYNSNGGSQNLPTDGSTYESGDTVTVKFDYIPSLYGYVFLGWSTDRYATEPMYTDGGYNTFIIGSDDVTLYAVWALEVCEHNYELISITDSTCCYEGECVYACSLCGESYTEVIPTIPHHYQEGHVVQEPTCTEEGLKNHDYCDLPGCEEVYAEVLLPIPALGHAYVSGVCIRCGEAEPVGVGAHSEYNASTGDVFLGGNYIELGISRHGSFGTSTRPTTSGFHSLSNYSYKLGLVVDEDGWDRGEDPKTIDFYLPGLQEERYILAYKIDGVTYQYLVADRENDFTGSWNVEPTVRNESYGDTLRAVVSGETVHGVVIEIVYSFGVNDKFFTTEFSITNNGSYDITDLRYVRNCDPDQENGSSYGSTAITDNKVISNPTSELPGGYDNCAMVVAYGINSGVPLYLISHDNRARVSRGVIFTLKDAYMSGLWSATHSFPNAPTASALEYPGTGYTSEDSSIAITFVFGTLSCGSSVDGTYYTGITHEIDATGGTDVWDGSIDTSWYNSTDIEFTIYTAAQLAGLAYLVNNGNTFAGKTIYLGRNIDLAGREWTPIGYGINTGDTYISEKAFHGNFNGCYFTVSNMCIHNATTTYAGLFGCLYGYATVSNLGIVNACIDITRSVGYRTTAGLLAGASGGGKVVISNCYATGTVNVVHSGNNICDIGGFVGDCYSAEFYNCYCVADVIVEANNTSNMMVGIFCGWTDELLKITNCFAYGYCEGRGTGTLYLGAFGGGSDVWNGTNVYYCATASDREATKLTADQMKLIASFNGWDFENVWEMGTDYPVLRGFRNPTPPTLCHHTSSDWIVDSEPTCTTPGSRHTVCTTCGQILYVEEIPAPGHVYTNWVIDEDSTCTESGTKHADCDVCGDAGRIVAYIPPKGHNFNSYLTRPATCTTPGIMTYRCVCGYEYDVYIYSEHNYEHTSRTDATCTEDGQDVYTCSRCGDTYIIPIEGGHDYIAEIERLATPTSTGLVRYTCSICGHSYTEETPARVTANVLLVQDRFPWTENSNVYLLDKMVADGYITGWDLTTTANFTSVDLTQYNVILIANDQTTATYNQLRDLQAGLVAFASAGGVVIYGACDHGWASGNISYTLPEGVTKSNYYSHHNYIVDASHPIVLGTMTDGKALTNDLLYGNYCSHTAFNISTLPADANIILQDANGDPTLVEYAIGNGYMILSGLTWEFYYTRSAYDYRLNTTYTRNVYDDLIVYAASLSKGCEHAWNDGVDVPATCTEQGYILRTCNLCGATMKEVYENPLGHIVSDWIVELEATAEAEGLKVKRCERCGILIASEVIPMLDNAIIRVEAPADSVILGEELTFYVVIEGSTPIKSMALVPIFDSEYFELVSVSWVIDAFVTDIEDGTLRSIAAWASLTDVNTTVYAITLRAKALTVATEVDFTAKLQDDSGIIVASVVGKTVAIIECPHAEVTYFDMSDSYHTYTCNLCGYTVMEAHTYYNACDTDCELCGHERVAPHAMSEYWLYDADAHWHECTLCNIPMMTSAHVYDDAADTGCNECDYHRVMLGDLDNDGDVDSDDAVYLAYVVLFGEGDYPKNQPIDFDGDGDEDSDDAIWLLYNSFYGNELYELHSTR